MTDRGMNVEIPVGHVEATCVKCGGPNVGWNASAALWHQVAGDAATIWCPVCFIREMNRRGIYGEIVPYLFALPEPEEPDHA